MTNDFAVSDSQQTRKSPMLPLIGAVGGGYAGYKLANRRGADKDWNDLIKEVKDTTDFSKKENPDLWQGVKDKLAEVDRLEAELKKASEKTVTGPELENLNAAKDALQKEIERLQVIENGKVPSASFSHEAFNPAKLPKYTELGMEDLPSTYTSGKKAGKNIKPTEMQKWYEKLVSDAQTAHNDLQAKLKSPTGLETQQKTFIDGLKINNAFYKANLAGAKEDAIITYFNDAIRYDSFGKKSYSPQFDKVMSIVEKEYPIPGSLAAEDIRAIGQVVDAKAPTTPGMSRFIIRTPKESGRGFVTEIIEYDGKAYGELLTQKQAEVMATRETVASQIFNEAQNTFRLSMERDNLPKVFGENVERSICEKTGLYNARTDVLDIAKIIDPANSSQYSKDIKSLQGSLKNATKNPYDKAIVSKYTTVAGTTPTKVEVQKALEAANARNRVFMQYERELKSLKSQIEESLKANDIFKEYETKIADFIGGKEGEAVRKADKALMDQFPTLFKESSEGVSGTAKTITENDVAQAFRDKVKTAQEAFDKAAKKDGAVDETAKKNAEEALAKGKKELEDAGKKLGEKIGKTGGTKGKIIGTIIGVAAGAGLLWMIAPKKSKKA